MTELERRRKLAAKDENKANNTTTEVEDDTTSEEVNDYEQYDPIPNQRQLIAKDIGDMVFGEDITLEIYKGGVVNEQLTKIVNKAFRSNNVLGTIQLAFEHALINKWSLLRIGGNIYSPKIYLAASSVATWDKNNENRIKKARVMFNLDEGTQAMNIVRESYDFKKGKLISVIGNAVKTTKIASSQKSPFLVIVPIKENKTGRKISLFEYVKEKEDFYTATFNKQMVYAKDVNYHILPDKKAIFDGDDSTKWKNKMKNLFIFRKNKMAFDSEAREAIDKIEPNMDWFIKVISANDEAGKGLLDSIGIQNPTFQGTKQMSEHEINVLKQKEKITINKFRLYMQTKIETILSMYLPSEDIEVKIQPHRILTKNDIEMEKIDRENQDESSDNN